MSSIAWDEAVVAFKALADQADEPAELWSTPQRLAWLDNVETLARILPALRHQPINDLLALATTQQVGGSLQHVLADRLRIYRRDAARRIEEAADLGARTTLIGEPLPPKLEHTAAGQRAGLIGVEQVAIIRTFFDRLPCWIDEPTRAQAEDKLAQVAANYRPDELQRFADWYAAVLNPDGDFTDADRARKRGVTIGAQGRDGMSAIKGWLDPELRSGLDAIFAKLAAPGMCNPAQENPTIEGDPSQQAIDADCRSAAQRNHDALNAGC